MNKDPLLQSVETYVDEPSNQQHRNMFSKISADSQPTVNGRYDFFKTPPTETTAIKRTYISVQPSSIADSGNLIQLVVAADDGKATSLGESYAIVKGKFRKKSNRANLPAHTHANMTVVAEDNLAHSLWDRCTLHANGQEIFHTSNYAQMAYMQTLIHKTEDEKTTSLAVEGWLPSSEEPAKDFAGIGDAAKTVRKEKIAAGKEVVLVFRPKILLSDSSRHIPPGTSLRFLFHKADPKTYCLSSEANCDVEFKVETFEYFICRIELNPAVTNAWQSQLLDGASYILPVERHRIRSHTVPQGVTEQRIALQEEDTLPLSLCVAFVEQKAVVGDFPTSQFKYSPNNVASIELTVDGITVAKRLNCDFANRNAVHAYIHTLSSLGHLGGKPSNGITHSDFLTNRTVFAWTLIDDNDEDDYAQCFHLKQKGSMEILVRFSAPTTAALSALVLDRREDLVYQNIEGTTHSIESIV